MLINDLPRELLARIFSYMNDWMCGEKPLRHREPHLLTDVCVKWREIALSERGLWNKLIYDWKLERGQRTGRVYDYSCYNNRRLSTAITKDFSKMALISSYLERAASRPLYLIFNLHPSEPSSPFAKMFQRHSSFLRNLSLCAPLSVYRALAMMTRTSTARKARFPMLEFLHFSMPCKNSDKASVRKFTSTKQIDLTGCITLRKLHVDSPDRSFGFITDNLVSGIPYSQLTRLVITDFGLSLLRGREILTRCTSLVSCSLTISQWEERDVIPLYSTPTLAPVALPHLRNLIVDFSGITLNGQISPFFQALTLPALAKLTLSAPHAADENIVGELIRLQLHSCAPILILGLINVTLSYEEVPDLLRLLPLLQYLRIEAPRDGHCYSLTNILRAIQYNRGESNNRAENMLPELKEVHISDNLSDWHAEQFSRWLEDGFKPQQLDLSQFLGDHEVLDYIESRCWREGTARGSVDTVLQSLDVFTMVWRNVPVEWLTINRRVEKRRDEMEKIYPIGIYLLLEGRE
ncbi:hypothetical protein C0992_009864 [Termitomyces sp. T32_za158]|nr:hypothetical protein C0992_009864 [Termitomyces sp. T32_za158]